MLMNKKIAALSLIILICVGIVVGVKWYKIKGYVSVKNQPTKVSAIKIEPTKGKPFTKMILNDKGTISYFPAGILKKQPLKVGRATISEVQVVDNKIHVKQKIHGDQGVSVILQVKDFYYPRHSFSAKDIDNTTYRNFEYIIDDPADKRLGLPKLDISDVKTIIFEDLGECIAIPFEGGNGL